ncbi:MAG TPA: hypothetical protein PK466_08775 [Thermotogota bacterium]|nr:hypothetical protein [Thermotogota bacterium]HPJ89214.1 hypothetical protein [Thermotogota bacterium]HPR96410.1 hypothetical protein [Thermotogota bacterium]
MQACQEKVSKSVLLQMQLKDRQNFLQNVNDASLIGDLVTEECRKETAGFTLEILKSILEDVGRKRELEDRIIQGVELRLYAILTRKMELMNAKYHNLNDAIGKSIMKYGFQKTLGTPWQIIPFGFIKLGYSIEEVIKYYSQKQLNNAYLELESKFYSRSARAIRLHSNILFSNLKDELEKPVGEIILNLSSEHKHLIPFLKYKTGEILLTPLLGEKPADRIRTNNVKIMLRLTGLVVEES